MKYITHRPFYMAWYGAQNNQPNNNNDLTFEQIFLVLYEIQMLIFMGICFVLLMHAVSYSVIR